MHVKETENLTVSGPADLVLLEEGISLQSVHTGGHTSHITPSHITLCLSPLRACNRGCIGPCSVDVLAMCNLKSVCQFQVTHPNVFVA